MWAFIKKQVLWFMDRITRDRLDSSAAHSAFFLITSFLPFLAFLLTLMQRIHFSSGVTMIEAALNLLPEAFSAALGEIIPSPIEASGVLPVAVIAAVWSSSMGMVAIIKGLDHIYEVEQPRNYILLRAMAVVYVVALAVVLIVAAVLLVFGTTIYRAIQDRWPLVAALLINFKSLVSFVMLFVFFALLYSFVPRRRVKLRHNLLGAVFWRRRLGAVLILLLPVCGELLKLFHLRQPCHAGHNDVLAVFLYVYPVPWGRGQYVAGAERRERGHKGPFAGQAQAL